MPDKVEIKDLPEAEKKLVDEALQAATDFQNTEDYKQIKKNHDYFKGGYLIDLSLRGGYTRFSLGGLLTSESALRSPKGGDPVWRAPAQKDDEAWVKFAQRRLEYANYVRPIVKKLGSILYKHPPIRTFEGNLAAQVEDVYKAIENESKGKFESYHINAVLGGTTAVIPKYYEEADQVIFQGWPRRNFTALFEGMTKNEMRLFVLFGRQYKNGQWGDIHQVWSADKVYTIEDAKYSTSVEHYCGEVPICLFKENTYELTDNNFGTITASDIVNGNEELNIKLSDRAHGCDHQSFATLLTKNIPQDVTTGAGARIDVQDVTDDRPASAEYLDPKAPLEALEKIILNKIDSIFQTGGIPKVVIFPDTSATSGVHLMIQWQPVQEIFDESKIIYQDNERRLADKVALVLTRWRGQSAEAEVPELTTKVDFDERNVLPKDDEAKLAQDEWDLGIGLKSPVDILMERNPDYDEDAAIEAYKHIQELNKKIGYTPGGNQTGEFKSASPKADILTQIEEEEEEEAA